MTPNPLLFACVSGEKYLNKDRNGYTGDYPNIAAFKCTDDTKKNIENVFLTMVSKWSNMPTDIQLLAIEDILRKQYAEEYVDIFDMALKLNSVC